jgi:hypothetical protein
MKSLQNPPEERLTNTERPGQGFSLSRWGWLGVIMLGLYLLFNHGCHADVDDEPGVVPEIKQGSKRTVRSE